MFRHYRQGNAFAQPQRRNPRRRPRDYANHGVACGNYLVTRNPGAQ